MLGVKGRTIHICGSLLLATSLLLAPAVESAEAISPNREATGDAATGWQIIGPGGGGGIVSVAISPFDPEHLFAFGDMTGVYRSSDAGKKWQMFSLWTVPTYFEFDPGHADTVYAATRGYLHDNDRGSGLSLLYRSEDRGRHWQVLFPDVAHAGRQLKALQSDQRLPSEIIPGAIDGSIARILVDPKDDNHIYLGLEPLRPYLGGGKTVAPLSSIVVSVNRGKTWQQIAQLKGRNIRFMVPGGQDPDDVLTVLTEMSGYCLNGKTGGLREFALPVSPISIAAGGSGNNGAIIYVTGPQGSPAPKLTGRLYRSRDWGMHWTEVELDHDDGLAGWDLEGIKSMGACRTRPEVLYISFSGRVKRLFRPEKKQYWVYRSKNAGEEWTCVWLGDDEGMTQRNFKGGWLDRVFSPSWGGAPHNLSVAPNNEDICYAADNGRVIRTQDGGASWEQVYSRDLPDGSVASNGLDVTTSYGVHFDPYDQNHIFITYTDIGLFHSYNRGHSWYPSLEGIPHRWQNTCYWIVFDPHTKGRIWSAWSQIHDLPREKMFRRFSRFGSSQGGVAISSDGGISWKKSNKGLPEASPCTHLVLDKSGLPLSKILYVCVFGQGVFKSLDGGGQWQKASKGLGKNRYAWQMRQGADGRLFLVVVRGRAADGVMEGKLYASQDQAQSWQPVALPEGVTAPHDLQIDPKDPQRLWLSCWPTTVAGEDRFGGLYLSEDGGNTWRQVFDERWRVNSSATDPRIPGRIYINTFHNAAFQSNDGGKNWDRLKGYRFKWGQRVIPDPIDPARIFITTYGGSVFYGPAGGSDVGDDDIYGLPPRWW